MAAAPGAAGPGAVPGPRSARLDAQGNGLRSDQARSPGEDELATLSFADCRPSPFAVVKWPLKRRQHDEFAACHIRAESSLRISYRSPKPILHRKDHRRQSERKPGKKFGLDRSIDEMRCLRSVRSR